MNLHKSIINGSKIYMSLSILSVAYVSVLSLINPQATMDLVYVQLDNTDAISSIRGVYGGVGIVLTITLVHLLLSNIKKGVLFLSIFWGAYAFSRLITIINDGPLGGFGNQWLAIELIFSLIALIFFISLSKFKSVPVKFAG